MNPALLSSMPDYDVIVAGGGSAGVAAAIAAARSGARTLLLEQSAVLGGQAPLALVHSICGLYHLADDGPARFANGGLAEEFATRLMASGGAHGPVRMGRVWVLLTRPAAVAELALAMARETPQLEVRLGAELSAASGNDVAFRSNGTEGLARGRTLIDATGDGALAAALGAPFEQTSSDRLQRPAYIFGLRHVNAALLGDDARLVLARYIVGAVQEGRLPASALGATVRETGPLQGVFVSIDLSATADYDPNDHACVAALNAEGRELADRLTRFLSEEVEGFRGCEIAEWPARIGVRESRRIVGQYRVEAADIESGAQFADGVAAATWPMEMRETNRGPRLRYSPEGRAPQVPLRALRFRDLPHCFMAGRCLSASHEAHASLRVIGTCLATGEAAGRAAALQALGKSA